MCRVSSPMRVTKWSYITGSAGTALMRYENGTCNVSPSDSFLNTNTRYSYGCRNGIYQVTLNNISPGDHGNIFACRDTSHSEKTGSTWMIKVTEDSNCVYCQPTMIFNVTEVTEGNNITFDCAVHSDTKITTWSYYMYFGSYKVHTFAHEDKCIVDRDDTYLDTASESSFACNSTLNQVKRFNVQRSRHNDIYMCTPDLKQEGSGSNWIIKVKVPITSVNKTPSASQIEVTENGVIDFTCQTSPARPPASIKWYIRYLQKTNPIEGGITSKFDYDEFPTSYGTLRFVPLRIHHRSKIFCKAENVVNSSPISSSKTQLNVLYKAELQYFGIDGSKNSSVTVDERTVVQFECVADGNPIPNITLRNSVDVLVSETAYSIVYNLSKVSCQDTDTYTCTVQNEHNLKMMSTNLELLVNCLPRLVGSVEKNVKAKRNEQVKLNVTVLAYPLPVFTWWKNNDVHWLPLQTTDDITIQSDELDSHLIIKAMRTEDVATYKVVAENGIGEMKQVFTVSMSFDETIEDYSSTDSSPDVFHIIYAMAGGAVALVTIVFIVGIVVGRKTYRKGCMTNDRVSNRREDNTMSNVYLHPVLDNVNREDDTTNDVYMQPAFDKGNSEGVYDQPDHISHICTVITPSYNNPQGYPRLSATYENLELRVM
ncbi:hypothetical protein ACF0H5_019132 [Mactra antiquata]